MVGGLSLTGGAGVAAAPRRAAAAVPAPEAARPSAAAAAAALWDEMPTFSLWGLAPQTVAHADRRLARAPPTAVVAAVTAPH